MESSPFLIFKLIICECQRIFEPFLLVHGTALPSQYFFTVFLEMPSSLVAARWLVTPSSCNLRISLYTSNDVTTFQCLLQCSDSIIGGEFGGSSIHSHFTENGSGTVYHSQESSSFFCFSV